MKNYKNILFATACAGTLTLGSCIEETIPTSVVTDEVLGSSSSASEALVWAMPAFLNHHATYGSDYHYDYGYGSIMHMRDVMTADQAVVSCGYNWYDSWSTNTYMGERYVSQYFMWAYYYKAINTTNNTIGALKNAEQGLQAGYLGAAHAFRAFFYLDVARMYEFLPNDGTSGTSGEGESTVDITYLTVPIVTDETPADQVRNNPRATHEQMYEFILSDLQKAEKLVPNYSRSMKTLPDLACVYGLQARLYMWNAGYLEEIGKTAEAQAEYKKAEEAARNAINEGVNTPVSEAEWLDTKTGFNSLSCKAWMWGANATTDDDVVQTGIVNWTSWMSNEATFGYAAAEPMSMIGSALYDQMSDEDFRKLSFIAPQGSVLAGKEPLIVTNPEDGNYMRGSMPDYASLKFRPGAGNVEEYKVGAACDYPIMRIEEMYLIEAEAAAHQDGARGASLLNSFVQTYRYSSYNCRATSSQDVVDECFLQKRIELWGEGQIFFDYKRLNKPVDRTTSNNWDPSENFKTTTRPAWMNFCICVNEVQNNKGVEGRNNPDPSNAYTPVQ